MLTGGKHKDFTLLSEYFVLASGIAATWKDMKDRDEFEDAMSELAHSLAKMDNLILTSLLLLPKAERSLIAQTCLAEEMVTMSLSKPLALIMHTIDMSAMVIFAPVYATLCYHAILEKKILRKFTERTRMSGTPLRCTTCSPPWLSLVSVRVGKVLL